MAQRVLLEVEPEWAEEESGWRSAEEILMAGRPDLAARMLDHRAAGSDSNQQQQQQHDLDAQTSANTVANETAMEAEIQATFEHCGSFNSKLKDTLSSLLGANNDRKSEIEGLRSDHDALQQAHDAFQNSMERENDLRKNEIRSLEERQQKDNTARITDIAKLDGKLDSENGARKAEIAALDGWAKGENDARKTEIENLNNFARSENDSRKAEIADLDSYAKGENEARISDIADINSRMAKENEERTGEDSRLNDMINKEQSDREAAVSDLESRMNGQNDDRIQEIDDLRTKLMRENQFLRNLANKSNSVYFDAYRTKAYDGGGEENLTFQGCYCNGGGGMDAESGIFTAPAGGTYLFIFHIATHDNKKALLSIRKNGEEIASIFDQNHKDNHKNSMAGQTIIIDAQRGDEIVVYAYTGTWLADFPMNHYTHWIGLLLKPNKEEVEQMKKEAMEGQGEKEESATNGF